MKPETTSINVTGIPKKEALKVYKLAALETKGKAAPMAAKLISEAIKARENKAK